MDQASGNPSFTDPMAKGIETGYQEQMQIRMIEDHSGSIIDGGSRGRRKAGDVVKIKKERGAQKLGIDYGYAFGYDLLWTDTVESFVDNGKELEEAQQKELDRRQKKW